MTIVGLSTSYSIKEWEQSTDLPPWTASNVSLTFTMPAELHAPSKHEQTLQMVKLISLDDLHRNAPRSNERHSYKLGSDDYTSLREKTKGIGGFLLRLP
nr:hypothetical protein [uncultured Cohaesibacter sp.]